MERRFDGREFLPKKLLQTLPDANRRVLNILVFPPLCLIIVSEF